ncbi:hypothetical protein DER46DRAFT_567013 [Fusarium sp. MPI-SDFR-AT-0072]|nr:hypothetical protein DER46DRAFT_567013 [Fusarium sp. MPI-SDFR-AT-0072]
MVMSTESDIDYWLCMSETCTKMNGVGDKSCQRCDTKLASGAKALSAGIDEIGECEGMNSDGNPVWKLCEPDTMDFSGARASTTYVRVSSNEEMDFVIATWIVHQTMTCVNNTQKDGLEYSALYAFP